MKDKTQNKYVVGHCKYIWLSLGAVTLLLVGTGMMICNSPNQTSVSGSLMQNVGAGLLASAVVAWLIEGINVKEKNEERDRLFKSIYAGLKCNLFELLSIPVQYYNASREEKCTIEKTWEEWLKVTLQWIVNRESEVDKRSRVNNLLEQIKEQSVELRNAATEIIDKEYLLRINRLIDGEIYCSIDEIRIAADGIIDLEKVSDNNREEFASLRLVNDINSAFDRFIKVFSSATWKAIDPDRLDKVPFNADNYWRKIVKPNSYLNEKEA